MAARLLTVLGPKGGVGKSTIASNLLVAARLQGIEAAGLDLDFAALARRLGGDAGRHRPGARLFGRRGSGDELAG